MKRGRSSQALEDYTTTGIGRGSPVMQIVHRLRTCVLRLVSLALSAFASSSWKLPGIVLTLNSREPQVQHGIRWSAQ